MTVVYPGDTLQMMLVGKVGKEGAEDPLNVFGIYRRRPTKTGYTLVKMGFYTPTNPQTEPQQAWRLIFSNGVDAWHLLNEEEKEGYRARAKDLNMTGFNLFMSEYLLAN